MIAAISRLHRWRFVGATLLGTALSLPLLSFEFSFDQGIFGLFADVILRGGTMYRDAWEHRPPLIYYTYAFAFLTLGRDFWTIRLVEMAVVGLTSAGLLRVGERRFGSPSAGWISAVLFPLTYVFFGAANTGQSEVFQAALLTWAYAVWPLDAAEEGGRRRAAIAGFLLGMAVLYKPTVLLIAGVFLVDAVRLWWNSSDRGSAARLGLGALAALAAPMLLFLAMAAVQGVLPACLDAVFRFPYRYALTLPQGGHRGVLGHLGAAVSWMPSVTGPALALLGMIGMIRLWFWKKSESALLGLLFLAAWGSAIVQMKYHGYHFVLLMPFLILGMGVSVAGFEPSPVPRRQRITRGIRLAFAVLLGIGLVQILSWEGAFWGRAFRPAHMVVPEGEPVAEAGGAGSLGLARVIRSRTNEKDSVLFWGNDPLAMFLSGRRMAGPYAQLLTMAPPWGDAARVNALLGRLRADRPAMVLIGTVDSVWHREDSSTILNQYPELKAFIRENYRSQERVGRVHVWVRSDASPAPRAEQ